MWVLSKHAGMGYLCVRYTNVYAHIGVWCIYCGALVSQLDMSQLAKVNWEEGTFLRKCPHKISL